MARAEEILIWAGLDVPEGGRLPSDSGIVTMCPTCDATQTLADADFAEGDVESVYTCRNGCQPILVIGPPGTRSWPGRGYRMGNFVLRNPSDVRLRIFDNQGTAVRGEVLLPASPAALADESETP